MDLSKFAKKVGVANVEAKAKTASCLESCEVLDGKVILTLSLDKYAEAQATSSGKEIYLNFTCPKQNVEIDGNVVGLRIAGNAFIGQAK